MNPNGKKKQNQSKPDPVPNKNKNKAIEKIQGKQKQAVDAAKKGESKGVDRKPQDSNKANKAVNRPKTPKPKFPKEATKEQENIEK